MAHIIIYIVSCSDNVNSGIATQHKVYVYNNSGMCPINVCMLQMHADTDVICLDMHAQTCSHMQTHSSFLEFIAMKMEETVTFIAL